MNKIKLVQPLCYLIVCFMVCIITLMPVHAFAQRYKAIVAENHYFFDTAAFKACHASTVVLLPGNKLMAAWFGGAYEGSPDVCIWTSIKEDSSWARPGKSCHRHPTGWKAGCLLESCII